MLSRKKFRQYLASCDHQSLGRQDNRRGKAGMLLETLWQNTWWKILWSSSTAPPAGCIFDAHSTNSVRMWPLNIYNRQANKDNRYKKKRKCLLFIRYFSAFIWFTAAVVLRAMHVCCARACSVYNMGFGIGAENFFLNMGTVLFFVIVIEWDDIRTKQIQNAYQQSHFLFKLPTKFNSLALFITYITAIASPFVSRIF